MRPPLVCMHEERVVASKKQKRARLKRLRQERKARKRGNFIDPASFSGMSDEQLRMTADKISHAWQKVKDQIVKEAAALPYRESGRLNVQKRDLDIIFGRHNFKLSSDFYEAREQMAARVAGLKDEAAYYHRPEDNYKRKQLLKRAKRMEDAQLRVEAALISQSQSKESGTVLEEMMGRRGKYETSSRDFYEFMRAGLLDNKVTVPRRILEEEMRERLRGVRELNPKKYAKSSIFRRDRNFVSQQLGTIDAGVKDLFDAMKDKDQLKVMRRSSLYKKLKNWVYYDNESHSWIFNNEMYGGDTNLIKANIYAILKGQY